MATIDEITASTAQRCAVHTGAQLGACLNPFFFRSPVQTSSADSCSPGRSETPMSPDEIMLLCGFCAVIGGAIGYIIGFLRGEAKGWRDSQ
jgi:hypothetical protein